LKNKDGSDIDLESIHEKAYILFSQVWSAYWKYIRKIVVTMGKACHCSLFGVFGPRGVFSIQEFMPT